MEYVLSRNIPIEGCLTSNVKTKLVSSEVDHPVQEYMKEGQIICVSTDDPLIFQTDIWDEYSKVYALCGIDETSHDDFLNACIIHSFATEDQKRRLSDIVMEVE